MVPGHRIRIATVNLGEPWETIEAKLKSLVASHCALRIYDSRDLESGETERKEYSLKWGDLCDTRDSCEARRVRLIRLSGEYNEIDPILDLFFPAFWRKN